VKMPVGWTGKPRKSPRRVLRGLIFAKPLLT
jgi:hypothetical protein